MVELTAYPVKDFPLGEGPAAPNTEGKEARRLGEFLDGAFVGGDFAPEKRRPNAWEGGFGSAKPLPGKSPCILPPRAPCFAPQAEEKGERAGLFHGWAELI